MSWAYNVKFANEDEPRRFTAEKQLSNREIQERCGNNALEWFYGKRISDD